MTMEEAKHCQNQSVVMLPWLAHGHITPYMELAKKLSERNFHIYFCSSTICLAPLKRQLQQQHHFSCSSSIDLIDLNLPSLPSLPPHLHTTKGLPPHLHPALQEALDSSNPNFLTIIRTCKPDLFIYDYNFPWHLVSEHDEFNPLREIPSVMFVTSSAAAVSFRYQAVVYPGTIFPFPEVVVREQIKTQAEAEALLNEVGGVVNRAFQGFKRSSSIVLFKSLREIEGKYIDHLSGLTQKRVVPVGSLVPETHDQKSDDGADVFMKWLDAKAENSTIFVSFGSECFPSKKEIEEIAHGVELSGVSFIWVVRFPREDETEIGEALPDGFLERTKGRGLIAEGWAPQVAILKHSSTGGFLSHCGWGSSMEAMTLGVPIIAMPMLCEQPENAKLVAHLGVGMEIERNTEGTFGRSEIARVIREALVEKGGEEVRRRARELGERVRRKGEEAIDGVAQELHQLCNSRKV